MSNEKTEAPGAVPTSASSPSAPTSLDLTNTIAEGQSIDKESTQALEDPFAQTPAQVRLERLRFVALLYSFFLLGWNDGSTGPLLPAIRAYYNVGFTEVSTFFIVSCAGSAVGSFSIFFMLDKLGFGKVLVLGAVLQTLAYVVQSTTPPFPAFIAVAFINGAGMALQGATGNGYVASIKRHGARNMGIVHAVYGLGAFAAPLISTQFAPMRHWALFYAVSAGLAVFAPIVLSVVFRFKRQEVLLRETNSEGHGEPGAAESASGGRSMIAHTLSLPLVHCLAFYIAAYVGVEATLGGWVVTFIINERRGGPSSGYISSGFFGGMTAGRILLLPLNSLLGERRVIFLYALLIIALDIVIWRVPSLIGDAVSVSIVGVLIGPLYPIVMHQAGLILPPRILAGAVGYIAGCGIVGAAIFPFITGALANRFEIGVMPIVVLVMMVIMAGLWAIAMKARKPRLD